MQKAFSESTCAETGPAFSQQLRLFQICHICPLLLWMVSSQDFNQVCGFINHLYVLLAWVGNLKRPAVKLWDKSCGQRPFHRTLNKKAKTVRKAGTFQVLTSGRELNDLSKSWSYCSTLLVPVTLSVLHLSLCLFLYYLPLHTFCCWKRETFLHASLQEAQTLPWQM